jgi:hypothetical protein
MQPDAETHMSCTEALTQRRVMPKAAVYGMVRDLAASRTLLKAARQGTLFHMVMSGC